MWIDQVLIKGDSDITKLSFRQEKNDPIHMDQVDLWKEPKLVLLYQGQEARQTVDQRDSNCVVSTFSLPLPL